LQVEKNGEAWYVSPDDQERYFLGRPQDAFQVMRNLGLGISNKDFNYFGDIAPERLSGKILIKVEDLGKAYYVNPEDRKMHFLGRPSDAFGIMRNLGLGISNNDLEKIELSNKPSVKLFVMSHCPYALQMEKSIITIEVENLNWNSGKGITPLVRKVSLGTTTEIFRKHTKPNELYLIEKTNYYSDVAMLSFIFNVSDIKILALSSLVPFVFFIPKLKL